MEDKEPRMIEDEDLDSMIEFAYSNGATVDQIMQAIYMLGINGFEDPEFDEDKRVLISRIGTVLFRPLA
jgi:hypothetical protein